jgi:DNA-binding MarR family transcriptional regulator/GNAT superfamily N-acetyltransferase
MDKDQIGQIRSFNRLVTQRIGALEESYLARGRPLGEARLIFEIGRHDGLGLGALRKALGLDSGYLSRLLRALEGQGLVEVSSNPDDGRARQVALTKKGREEFAAYDALSDRLAQSILASLGPAQRGRMVAAMADVERFLRIASIEIAAEAPDSADARWCMREYFAELARRFDGGFDPANGNALADDEMTPPAGWLLVARLDGEPVGCGALKRLNAGTVEVKRVWTAPGVRGMGIAGRLMDRLEALARETGFETLRLDTNRALAEAQAMYRKRGYHEIGRYNDNPYAHHWFEKGL